MAEPATIAGLLDRAAAARPDALALADAPNRASFFSGAPRRLAWREVADRVDTLAARLASAGVGVGDIVAIQLPNTVELVVGLLATARLGAVGCPYPVQHRGHELRHGFGVAPPAAVLTAPRPDRPDQLETVAAALADTTPAPVLTFGEAEHGTGVEIEPVSLDDPAATVARHAGAATDLATICWTSGTTGTPKGVPRTNAMWLASSAFQVEHLRMTAEDRMLCPFPVVNMAGQPCT